MKTIYLVSCVSKKRSSESAAEEIYCSELFRKARRFVIRQMKDGDEWYILSAKYGLVEPRTPIAPYEVTLNRMSKRERTEWAARVTGELRARVRPGNAVVFLAGQRYRELLQDELAQMGCTVSVPMAGLGIGRQLRWLERASRA